MVDCQRHGGARCTGWTANPWTWSHLRASLRRRVNQATELHAVSVLTDEIELVGHWDPVRLGRVLTNLLENAIKYSPDGGPVVVQLWREGELASVAVSDRGIGIPPDELERVFERFHRGSNAELIGGTGIGLASVRHIVDSHGGSIVAHNQAGGGTTFVIRLPLTADDVP